MEAPGQAPRLAVEALAGGAARTFREAAEGMGSAGVRLKMTAPLVPGGPFWLVVERTGAPREITIREALEAVNTAAELGCGIGSVDLFQDGGKNEGGNILS